MNTNATWRTFSIFISSTFADIAAGVGDIYFNSGLMDKVARSMDKAEEYFRKALSLEPENPDRLYDLASFLIDKDSNINEGLHLVDKALELSPKKLILFGYEKRGIL